MPFRFQRLEIPEVILIDPVVFEDERGVLFEAYKHSDFCAFGIRDVFVQDNHSKSVRGVLRGLHYQKRARAQGKLVGVVSGEIFDVAVDIRRGSTTYGRWVGVYLSADNRQLVFVPAGFAHGFCVLSDLAEVVYKATQEYAPDQERGVAWNDPELGIEWPIASPLISERDARFPTLRHADNDF